MGIGAPELIIVLVVVLLLFGSTRLPKLARSLGLASKEFKQGQAEGPGNGDDDRIDTSTKDRKATKAEAKELDTGKLDSDSAEKPASPSST